MWHCLIEMPTPPPPPPFPCSGGCPGVRRRGNSLEAPGAWQGREARRATGRTESREPSCRQFYSGVARLSRTDLCQLPAFPGLADRPVPAPGIRSLHFCSRGKRETNCVVKLFNSLLKLCIPDINLSPSALSLT